MTRPFGFLAHCTGKTAGVRELDGSCRMRWRVAWPSKSGLEEMLSGTWTTWFNSCLTTRKFAMLPYPPLVMLKSLRCHNVRTQEYEDGTVSTQLGASKSTLAPQKAMSIPRFRVNMSIDRSHINITDKQRPRDSHEQSHLLGGQQKCRLLISRTRPKLLTVCITSGGQNSRRFESRLSGGTFQVNLTIKS